MVATVQVAARLWAAGSSGLGQKLGGVYAGNVAGAIVGSLAAGFVLVPLLGAHHSLLLLAVANVLVGAVLLAVGQNKTGPGGCNGAPALVGVGLGANLPPPRPMGFP